MKTLGVGVVGVGSIGAVHAENLALNIPRANLVAISDVDPDAASKVANRFGIGAVYSDYNEMLENKNVEAIVFAVPPFLKREMIIKASKLGKHVFVEKPIALSLDDAQDILEATEDAAVKLQVGYQRRYDPAFCRIERSIANGGIGRLLLVKSWTHDPPGNPHGWSANPAQSGGIFLDTCSHDFDEVRNLTKASVVSVFARGTNLVYDQLKLHGDYDNVVITLELDNGALAVVDACGYTAHGYDAGIEVFGTEAVASVKMGWNSSAEVLGKSSTVQDLPQTYQERFAQAYRYELEDFVECVLSDRETRVTGKDGIEAMRIGLAARESAQTEQVVTL